MRIGERGGRTVVARLAGLGLVGLLRGLREAKKLRVGGLNGRGHIIRRRARRGVGIQVRKRLGRRETHPAQHRDPGRRVRGVQVEGPTLQEKLRRVRVGRRDRQGVAGGVGRRRRVRQRTDIVDRHLLLVGLAQRLQQLVRQDQIAGGRRRRHDPAHKAREEEAVKEFGHLDRIGLSVARPRIPDREGTLSRQRKMLQGSEGKEWSAR